MPVITDYYKGVLPGHKLLMQVYYKSVWPQKTPLKKNNPAWVTAEASARGLVNLNIILKLLTVK